MRKIVCIIVLVVLLGSSFTVFANSTSAKAAILINADTGEVIYEHNSNERLPMASTTKIMTALLLCEYGNFEKEITVTDEMLRVEGSSMGLLAGDRVTLHDLLYGMMLASGNDAANVTAYTLGGTINGFVKQMNEKANELGLENTHFATPSGLDAEDHFTTAYDLARLARFALQNEEFAKAAASEKAVLNYGNPPYRRTLTNHNKLLKSYSKAIGVKTGFTKKSGRCLVSAAEDGGKKVIVVTLNDPDDWQDHRKLLEYGLSAITLTEIKPEISEYKIPVISGEEGFLDINISPYTFSRLNDETLSCNVNLPQFVYAPVVKGEVIGSIIYKQGDAVIETVELKAENSIAQVGLKSSFFNEIFENVKHIFLNLWEK